MCVCSGTFTGHMRICVHIHVNKGDTYKCLCVCVQMYTGDTCKCLCMFRGMWGTHLKVHVCLNAPGVEQRQASGFVPP